MWSGDQMFTKKISLKLTNARNGHIQTTKIAKFKAPGIKEKVYTTVWIFGNFRGHPWKMFLESNVLLSNVFHIYLLLLNVLKIQTVIKSNLSMPAGASKLAIFLFLTSFFHFCQSLTTFWTRRGKDLHSWEIEGCL